MEWISYEAVRTWLALVQIVQIVVTGAVFVHARRAGRDRARRAEIVVLKREVGAVRERVQVIESELRHVPTHEDVGAVCTRLNGVAEQMERLKGHVTALSRHFSAVNEHLLNRGRRKA